MRSRVFSAIGMATALASITVFPWLAWQEAQRQALDAAADMAKAYARAVLHRADKTAMQADFAIAQLAAMRDAPCSEAGRALMRRLSLGSTYLQAVGHVRDGVMLCSSMGSAPFALGQASLRSSRGYLIYPRVPLEGGGSTPLVAFERHGYAALAHRDMPLDIATSIPGVSLGVLHLDAASRRTPELAKGDVRRAWLARLGDRRETSFVDGERLVALVPSARFRIAAVAALPPAYLHERTEAAAWRLVPAAALAGLALALAALGLARQQRSLGAELRHALRRNEFYLRYQPIVELASGRCVGVEALLRWRRPAGEEIGPELFVPVAEHTGLVTRLSARVLELLEAEAGPYLAANPGFHVAINLAAADLQSDAIVVLLDGFLRRSGARASNLIVEITERSVLDLGNAAPVVAALRVRGIEVAIDDFGTGYSNLSQLGSLELDFLKIDRSFVEAIGTGGPTSQVVCHLIAMARSMGLRMVAEGVESEVQAGFLREQGVQCAQGWLFGRPMAFEDAIRLAAQVEA